MTGQSTSTVLHLGFVSPSNFAQFAKVLPTGNRLGTDLSFSHAHFVMPPHCFANALDCFRTVLTVLRKLHAHRNHIKRTQLVGELSQVDGIFLRGNEGGSSHLLPLLIQGLDVSAFIGVVVAKRACASYANARLG